MDAPLARRRADRRRGARAARRRHRQHLARSDLRAARRAAARLATRPGHGARAAAGASVAVWADRRAENTVGSVDLSGSDTRARRRSLRRGILARARAVVGFRLSVL